LVNMWNLFKTIENVKNEAESLKTVLLNIINDTEISSDEKLKRIKERLVD
jgi:hypothetical protein